MNADDDPSKALRHRLHDLSNNDCYLAIAPSELLQGKSYVAFGSDQKTLAGYHELAKHMSATVTTKTGWRPTLDGIELRPQPTKN